MTSPLVSIVIPVWNSERFLGSTVESVLRQSVRDWELVMINDGSTDRSCNIADEFARKDSRVRVVTQSNAGVVPARNAGYNATNSASPYVIFLDHDDCWEDDALECLLGELMSHPESPAAYGLARPIDAQGCFIPTNMEQSFGYHRSGIREGRIVQIAGDAPTTFDILAIWPCFETPGQILIRRAALEQAKEPSGLFDEDARGSDEWELAMRLSLQGAIPRAQRFVIRKRQHDANAFNIPGYMGRAHSIRHKLATSPIYASHRSVAKQAELESIKFQFSWAEKSLRQRRLKQAMQETGRALRAYFRYVRLYSMSGALIRNIAVSL